MLRLLAVGQDSGNHDGEVLACAFTPDGASVLSAGWDGHLRLWDATTGVQAAALKAGDKPQSACAVTPDGGRWMAGSMEGLLTTWDAQTRRLLSKYVAHSRPVSAIRYTPDGEWQVTASWDRHLVVRSLLVDREPRSLGGHDDIVAGCYVAPDGQRVLSWSYDGTMRLWELPWGQEQHCLAAHADRVTAGAVSPDGRWVASGARDGGLKLWDLQGPAEAASLNLGAEVRACVFLLDCETLVAVTAEGRVVLCSVPELAEAGELLLDRPVQCGALAPSGGLLAVGCDDGRLRFVALDGFDQKPLYVTATQRNRHTRTLLQKLVGGSCVTKAFAVACPACGRSFELFDNLPRQSSCPSCRRKLRFNTSPLVLQEK